MRAFEYQLMLICRHNRDGSYATQDNRMRILSHCAGQLYEMGFRHLDVSNLKPKHIEALVALWRAEGLSAATIKNRMSALRWLAEKIGKQNIIKRSNRDYGIADRVFVTNVSKATTLDEGRLALVTCPWVEMSLRLEAAFGCVSSTGSLVALGKLRCQRTMT